MLLNLLELGRPSLLAVRALAAPAGHEGHDGGGLCPAEVS